ncbi:MAG: LptE family protein [Planctomycetes bacterium]|nr:LptE family protein [Planctomycetota bacterium]
MNFKARTGTRGGARQAWTRRSAGLACALVGAWTLAGCGYSTQPLTLDSVRTVAVPIFDNTTERRLHEFDLTNAVVREIHSRTPLRVAEPERADAILTGRLTTFRTPVLVEAARERVLDATVTLTLEITLTERTTGKVLLKDAHTLSAEFSGQREESIDSATAEVVEKLARWVVQRMEKAW